MLQDAPPVSSEGDVLRFRQSHTGGAGAGAQNSFAVSEISCGAGEGDGEVVMERCTDCGRTFAPGRLKSHAKVMLSKKKIVLLWGEWLTNLVDSCRLSYRKFRYRYTL